MDLSWLYGEYNASFLDSYWVAVHFMSGVLTGTGIVLLYRKRHLILTRASYGRFGISLLILWEYFEVFLRYLERYQVPFRHLLDAILPHGFFEIETSLNIMSDLLIGSLGLYLAYRYWKPSVQK